MLSYFKLKLKWWKNFCPVHSLKEFSKGVSVECPNVLLLIVDVCIV